MELTIKTKLMTAVQWFAKQLGITSGTMLKQAKEMEKQQIIDAAERWKGTDFAEKYYNETYGSKESDTPHVTPQVTPQVTSSQTEISDEEIAEKAEEFELNNGIYGFKHGVKWYRERLKSKQ